jgi:hypothetical protein
MNMDLMDLLAKAGGDASVRKMGQQLGLGGADTGKLIAALAPALLKGMQNQGKTTGGFSGLEKALASGKHERYLDDPDLVSASATKDDGNNILGHLFGSKDVSRNVAADAAASTGIDASLIRKSLPILAAIAMGAMSKNSGNTAESNTGGIGSLLGALTGGGTSGLDGLLGMAKKLF